MSDAAAPPGRPRTAAHALVSGGSSGIGLAIATALAREGTALTLLARDLGRLAAAHDAVRAEAPGARVRTASLDLSAGPAAEAGAEAALAEAEVAFGPVDLLVCAAGAVRAARAEDLTSADFRGLMELDFFGALALARPALSRMRRRGRGAILLVGSAAGLVALPGYAAYAPPKFALRGLAEALRAEAAPDGVLVSILHPPDTDTPQLRAEREERPEETAALAAAGGVARPEAIARAALRGLRARRAEILPGASVWAAARLLPLVAPLWRRWVDRAVSRARTRR